VEAEANLKVNHNSMASLRALPVIGPNIAKNKSESKSQPISQIKTTNNAFFIGRIMLKQPPYLFLI